MTDKPVVPLPEYLSTCGCPGAPVVHQMDCGPAIQFDETPLSDRPEYSEGVAFASISWAYPLTITGSMSIHVSLDPVAIIEAHIEEYQAYEMENGFEDWEKPIQFICDLIEQQQWDGVWFGGRRLSRDSSYMDDLSEQPRWTRADTEALDARLMGRPQPDPNQGALDLGEQ